MESIDFFFRQVRLLVIIITQAAFDLDKLFSEGSLGAMLLFCLCFPAYHASDTLSLYADGLIVSFFFAVDKEVRSCHWCLHLSVVKSIKVVKLLAVRKLAQT